MLAGKFNFLADIVPQRFSRIVVGSYLAEGAIPEINDVTHDGQVQAQLVLGVIMNVGFGQSARRAISRMLAPLNPNTANSCSAAARILALGYKPRCQHRAEKRKAGALYTDQTSTNTKRTTCLNKGVNTQTQHATNNQRWRDDDRSVRKP